MPLPHHQTWHSIPASSPPSTSSCRDQRGQSSPHLHVASSSQILPSPSCIYLFKYQNQNPSFTPSTLNSAKLGFPLANKPTQSLILERVMGIEPTCPAWKAGALPLSYTRLDVPTKLPNLQSSTNMNHIHRCHTRNPASSIMVEGVGFEPT